MKRRAFTPNTFTTITLMILIAAIAITALLLVFHRNTVASPAIKPAVGAAVPSHFSFSGSAGWWQGATNKTSMALFHKTDGCFTSVEYKTGTVDATAELQKTQASLTSDGYTVTAGNSLPLTIKTTHAPLSYTLNQSSVTSPTGSNKLMGGQEFGYVQLAGGYIKVMGYCDTPSQLAATLAPLGAITYHDSI